MKTFLKIALISSMLLIAGKPNAADNDLGGFISALTSVTEMFKTWFGKSEELAAKQDRLKFAAIGNDIYRNLDRLILSKKILVNKINANVPGDSLKAEVVILSKKVADLKNAILKSEAIAKSIGISATKVAGKLDYDFTIKDELIRNILNETGADSKTVALTNLSKGIQILENAKLTLDEFIKAMDKE